MASGNEARHLIDGEWVENGQWGTSLNPATGLALGRFSVGGIAEGDEAIASARKAFSDPAWAQNPRRRQMVMLRWADALELRKTEIAHLLMQENGKVWPQALGEIERSVSAIRYYAGLCRNLAGQVLEISPGEFATVIKEPIGVAGLIIPWNAPINLLVRALAPALAAGCTAVIKPAHQTALVTAEVIRTLSDNTDLPKGAVNLVSELGSEVATRLVDSSDVDVISFTGSTQIGKKIMAAAAPQLKRLSLELGGKSCCLVFEDTDIAQLAPKLMGAATAISGQLCVAARRILVHRSRYDEMKAALRSTLENMKVAAGDVDGAQMGPMIDVDARDSIYGRIADAMDMADEVIIKGSIPSGELSAGSFLTPTLVGHKDSSAFFCQEEIFGPFVVLEAFETEAEAVALANNSEFGLSASVWTDNGARSWRVARALADGVVWINDHGKLNAEAEAGGYRQSGIGRLYGVGGLTDFQELKQIYQNVGVIDTARE